MSSGKWGTQLKMNRVWRERLSYGMIDLVAGLLNDTPRQWRLIMRRLMLSMFACFGMLSAAACGTSVQIEPGFVILDTSPSGGAVNVDPDVELFVVLSQEVDEATLADGVTE